MITDRRQIVCLVSSAQQHLGTPHFGCGNKYIFFLFFRIEAKIVYIYNEYTKWKKEENRNCGGKIGSNGARFVSTCTNSTAKLVRQKHRFAIFCILLLASELVLFLQCRCRCRHCCCCYSFFKCIICAVAFAIAIAIDCYSVRFLYNRSPHITFLAIIFESLETFQMKCFT